MTLSKSVSTVLFLMAFVASANATLPKVSSASFSDGNNLISVRSANTDYYVILANRPATIEETPLKQEKILALKAKQILLKYIQSQYDDEVVLDIAKATPVQFWQSEGISYLIMAIDKTAVSISIITDEHVFATMDDIELNITGDVEAESVLGSEESAVTAEKIDEPVILTFNAAKRLYTEAIRSGDRMSAKKYLNIMKGK